MKSFNLAGHSAAVSLIKILLRFLIAAVLAAEQLFGGYAPFALGFIAACGGGIGGLSALAGAITGAAFAMDFSHLLRLSATGILLFSAAASLSGSKLFLRPLFYPVLASFLTAAVELMYLITGEATAVETAQCFLCIALVGLACYYYPPQNELFVFLPRPRRSHLFLLATLIAAAERLPFPAGLSLGRVGGLLFSMVIAYLCGPFIGGAAGFGMGLLLDLLRGGSYLFFSAAYALSAFFLGFQRQTGKLLSAGLFSTVLLFFLLPASSQLRLSPAPECLLAVLAFLALPLQRQGGKYLSEAEDRSAEGQLRAQLSAAAKAFEELAAGFPRLSVGEENPSVLFERTAEQVCRTCALADTCWKKEYQTSYDAFNHASCAMLRRGSAAAADFPPYFSDRCTRFPAFLAQLNIELRSYLQRRQYRSRLCAAHRMAQGQYTELAELLSGAAAAGTAAVPTGAELLCRVGTALRPKHGEGVSGDSLSTFESDDGRSLFLLLSDGMGAGAAAQKESVAAVRLLEPLLRSGIPCDTALRTLHSAMTLRNEENGAFTTIDLLSFDRISGRAALYKYGAAPSYLRENGTVRRIRSVNLPAGLNGDGGAPDITRLSLRPGTVFLMLSDGLTETEEDRWISTLLQQWSGRDPQSLATLLLCDSVAHGGKDDDCAAIVLYLPGSAERV